MAEVVIYIQSEEKGPSLWGKIHGQGMKTVFSVNPQFYLSDVEEPHQNYGVFKLEYDEGSQPSPEGLETVVRQKVGKLIGDGIRVGGIIMPADKINVSIEYVDD